MEWRSRQATETQGGPRDEHHGRRRGHRSAAGTARRLAAGAAGCARPRVVRRLRRRRCREGRRDHRARAGRRRHPVAGERRRGEGLRDGRRADDRDRRRRRERAAGRRAGAPELLPGGGVPQAGDRRRGRQLRLEGADLVDRGRQQRLRDRRRAGLRAGRPGARARPAQAAEVRRAAAGVDVAAGQEEQAEALALGGRRSLPTESEPATDAAAEGDPLPAAPETLPVPAPIPAPKGGGDRHAGDDRRLARRGHRAVPRRAAQRLGA